MTPDQLSKSGTEYSHQVALFAWAAVARWHGFAKAKSWAETGSIVIKGSDDSEAFPCLKWLHAIHNQGHGDAIRGGRAKAEGVRAGIPDIFLPVVKWCEPQKYEMQYAGLYIELKKPSMRPVRENSKGGLSPEQEEFRDFARANGYRWEVAYGWQEAAKIIQEYLT